VPTASSSSPAASSRPIAGWPARRSTRPSSCSISSASRSTRSAPPPSIAPLPGAEGLVTADLEGVAAIGRRLIAEFALDVDTATHLCGVYGARAHLLAGRIAEDRTLGERLDPELPYVWAEVEFAASHDLARTVEGVLARRVPLLLVSRDQGLAVSERVADVLGGRLGWDAALRTRMLDEYRAEVALSRRWR